MDFIKTYFFDPIYYNTGYNVVNTLVFALILIGAVFLTYRLLKKMKISIDTKFLTGIIPFVALGGILRAWEDLQEAGGFSIIKSFTITDAFGVQRNLLLVSPFIYIFIFVIALAALIFSKLLEKKMEYWKTWFLIGLVIDIFFLSQMRIVNYFGLQVMLGITIFWTLLIWGSRKVSMKYKLKIKEFFTMENSFLLNVHMFDATTTFTALTYFPYFEQHVLPGFLINIFGPWIMFLLKLVVVSAVLYLFDREMNKKQDLEKRTFLKIVILILGMGPGLRNFLRIIMGV